MAAVRPQGMECSYEALRREAGALTAVEDGLLAEQGGICAYTGHRISITPANAQTGNVRDVDFHIEHLLPQNPPAIYGQDADYQNLVACWPRPSCGFEPAYGARKKGNWPSPAEQPFFVSPLREDCFSRFIFNHRGEISPTNNGDHAAVRTIAMLGLDHGTLTALRREAIRGALNPKSHPIKLAEARKILTEIERDGSDLNQGHVARLRPFCFAIEPALRREIRKLEGIVNQP